jgi:hypothetical protein
LVDITNSMFVTEFEPADGEKGRHRVRAKVRANATVYKKGHSLSLVAA